MDIPLKNTILIVDDNPFNRKIVRSILSGKGYFVDEVAGGREALALLRNKHYDLIFMDLLMPGLDGFATTRTIRQMAIDTPIIAFSSVNFKQDIQHAIEAGCDEFLAKPVKAKELFALIERFKNNVERNVETSHATWNSPYRHGIRFSDYHLLLIEEDNDTRTFYQNVLQDYGFQVRAVSDGTQALSLLDCGDIWVDIVVSNIFTSGIDGIGVLNRVKHEYPDILVFLYMPAYDSDTFQYAVQQGVDGIILQDRFQQTVGDFIEAAICQYGRKGSRIKNAVTAKQVRNAQETLMALGGVQGYGTVDMAYASLHDAGGDMLRCRCFNKAGRCGVVLADAAGHDVESSYISAVFLGILMTSWNTHQHPRALLTAANVELRKLGYTTSHICATVLLWDRRWRIKIGTAGNPGGLWVQRDDAENIRITELSGGGMALGLLDEPELFLFEEHQFRGSGYLFHFSDGIEKTDIETVLHSAPSVLDGTNAGHISQRILDAIIRTRGQNDDMILHTLCIPKNDRGETPHFEHLSSYDGVDKACVWFENILLREQVPVEKEIDEVLIALREGVLNAVEHGNQKRPDAFFDIMLFFGEDALCVDISDEGHGFDVSKTLNEIEQMDGFQIGRRGLSLMNAIADAIEVTGGTVSMIFNLRK